jgi:SAM-dependent methyltransferase
VVARGAPRDLAATQRALWDQTYRIHPRLYGEQPSAAAVHAAEAFAPVSVREVLELGAGHGRDTLFFARCGFLVHATDFSAAGLAQLRHQARAADLAKRINITVHDVRQPLPLPNDSVDAVFAHMLLCMALSTREIRALVEEIGRVLRPGGILVYIVRHTGDRQYRTGIAHGDDIYEIDGVAWHFFPAHLINSLAEHWDLLELRPYEEGEPPRRLWRITQTLPHSQRRRRLPQARHGGYPVSLTCPQKYSPWADSMTGPTPDVRWECSRSHGDDHHDRD